ncbi:MAG: transporter permease [Enterovirga sp.]|nr:transporter permease [Enterovirga sp.]
MRISMFLAGLAASLFVATAGNAQTKVKIGVLTDLSGMSADLVGPGSVLAARMAAEDFAASDKSVQVQVIAADHQNKADIGLSLARRWYDQEEVDAIVDVPNSSIALAINSLSRERNKVALLSAAGTSELTASQCSPNTVQWVYDTWAQAHALGKSVTERGDKSWFFITADYAFAHSMQRDATAAINEVGGEVVGAVLHPYGSNLDFASYVVQAQGSKARTLGIISVAEYFRNIFQQAVEFRLNQRIVAFAVFLQDVKAIGAKTAQGLQISDAFYWDMNDETRAWSKRFAERMNGRPPSSLQAGVYGSVLHYLKAASSARSNEAKAVMAKMKELPTDDPLFGKGSIRADGRKLHNMYIFEVKKPEEMKGEWDLLKLVATIPPEQAFRPMSGSCSFVAAK